MKKRLLSSLLALCMVLAMLPTAFAAALTDSIPKDLSLQSSSEFSISVKGTYVYTYAYQVVEQVNRLRAGLGLNQLVIDPVLMETAMLRAAECAVYYSSSHIRPDGTKWFTAFPDRNWTFMAENIAAGYTTPTAAMNGWINSPGHYDNMINPISNAIGVGCFCADGTYYWAQSFTGGDYSTSSTRETDRQAIAAMSVTGEYFFPVSGSGAISLRVGESFQLPVWSRNSGFYDYTATLNGIERATLSSGTNLVRLNSDTLTITAVAAGSGTVALKLPSGDTLSFAVRVTGPLQVTGRPGGKGPFTDVPAGIWYADAVNWAARGGYVDGYPDGTFRPALDCTEEQILTLLYRAVGSPASGAPLPGAASSGRWYSDALRWAVEMGMVDDTFRLNTPCTRAKATYFLWKAYDAQHAEGEASFPDIPEGADYADAAAWAVKEGIVEGYPDGTFRPDDILQRAHIALLLHRTLVPGVRVNANV